MITSLKVLSLLLNYPTRELLDDLPALKEALNSDRLLSSKGKKMICNLCDDLAGLDLYEVQERYVFLFDRTRSHSLHLFEHVHGESRDRGQALVDLREMYLNNGFAAETTELPDYVPLFLEYLAHQPSRTPRNCFTRQLISSRHSACASRRKAQSTLKPLQLSPNSARLLLPKSSCPTFLQSRMTIQMIWKPWTGFGRRRSSSLAAMQGKAAAVLIA